MRIYLLKANAGDCFLLDFDNGSCVLIDGGYKSTYTIQLKQLLMELNNAGKHLEYLILTHYDSDHIRGLLALLEENGKHDNEQIIHIENILCNGFSGFARKPRSSTVFPYYTKDNTREEISAHEQYDFETLCLNNGYKINSCVGGRVLSQGDILEGKEYKIKILTPTLSQLNKLGRHLQKELKRKKYSLSQLSFQNLSMFIQEDLPISKVETISSTYYDDINKWKKYLDKGPILNLVNQCSLAFEIQFNEKHLLFCGDSDMSVAKPLLRDKYDVIKLSHHGTYHGNKCFIEDVPVTTTNYIISTNGVYLGREHPNRKLLSEIITLPHNKKLYFNYDMSKVKNGMYYLLNSEEQQNKYNFSYMYDYYYFEL